MVSDRAVRSIGHHELTTFISNRVQQLICGIGGHDLVLKVEPRRLALQCVSCPYETDGWTFDSKPPVARSARSSPVLEPVTQH